LQSAGNAGITDLDQKLLALKDQRKELVSEWAHEREEELRYKIATANHRLKPENSAGQTEDQRKLLEEKAKILKTKLKILSKRQANRERGEDVDLEVDSEDLEEGEEGGEGNRLSDEKELKALYKKFNQVISVGRRNVNGISIDAFM